MDNKHIIIIVLVAIIAVLAVGMAFTLGTMQNTDDKNETNTTDVNNNNSNNQPTKNYIGESKAISIVKNAHSEDGTDFTAKLTKSNGKQVYEVTFTEIGVGWKVVYIVDAFSGKIISMEKFMQ